MSTSAASVFPAASGTVNTRRSWLELNTIKNGTPMQAAATAKAVSQVTGPWESIQTKLNRSIRKRRENESSERESGAVQLGSVRKLKNWSRSDSAMSLLPRRAANRGGEGKDEGRLSDRA